MKLLHFASFLVAFAALTQPTSADQEHSVYAEIDSELSVFQEEPAPTSEPPSKADADAKKKAVEAAAKKIAEIKGKAKKEKKTADNKAKAEKPNPKPISKKDAKNAKQSKKLAQISSQPEAKAKTGWISTLD